MKDGSSSPMSSADPGALVAADSPSAEGVMASVAGGASGSTSAQPTRLTNSLNKSLPTSSARWWMAVGVGVLVSLPIGLLLSYAGTLPLFLGPFFFALFGLVIGATMHRTASPRRPYRKSTLLVGTAVVVAVCWGTSMAMEARAFPGDTAEVVGKTTRYLGGRTIYEFRREVAQQIRTVLTEDYGPGYTLGYVHWVATSGKLTADQIPIAKRSILPRQGGISWLLRVAFSIGLLAFGIGSQTLSLQLKRDKVVRAIDLVDEDRQE